MQHYSQIMLLDIIKIQGFFREIVSHKNVQSVSDFMTCNYDVEYTI